MTPIHLIEDLVNLTTPMDLAEAFPQEEILRVGEDPAEGPAEGLEAMAVQEADHQDTVMEAEVEDLQEG